MANADTTSGILVAAGFRDIALHRCDLPMCVGHDLDEAIDLMMSLGPAGEILRLAGDRAAHLHGEVDAALREGLAGIRGRAWRDPSPVVDLDRDGQGASA